MRIDPRLGTFEEVAAQAPQHAGTLSVLRDIAHAGHPDGVETASRRERSVSWGFDGGKATHWYAYAMPHAAHVNLGFFHGTRLPDPEERLEGTGKALRHVKLTNADSARSASVAALLTAARDDRRAALNLN